VFSIGGTGFLGAWILKTLLEQGYSVRAAVRSQSKADHIKKQFTSYVDNSKLEFTFVSDITTPAAFDEAVQGIAGIIHAASPISNPDPSTDPQELIVPAVEGTLGILRSAKKSPSIQRVVITSSGSAVFEPKPPPYTYTEVSFHLCINHSFTAALPLRLKCNSNFDCDCTE
jgi:nucleoside-diphosphate-sugar epimerase